MSKRQELGEENRTFTTVWGKSFLHFCERQMMFLLCNTLLINLNKSNANQHYLTHKDHKHVELEGKSRPAAL